MQKNYLSHSFNGFINNISYWNKFNWFFRLKLEDTILNESTIDIDEKEKEEINIQDVSCILVIIKQNGDKFLYEFNASTKSQQCCIVFVISSLKAWYIYVFLVSYRAAIWNWICCPLFQKQDMNQGKMVCSQIMDFASFHVLNTVSNDTMEITKTGDWPAGNSFFAWLLTA